MKTPGDLEEDRRALIEAAKRLIEIRELVVRCDRSPFPTADVRAVLHEAEQRMWGAVVDLLKRCEE